MFHFRVVWAQPQCAKCLVVAPHDAGEESTNAPYGVGSRDSMGSHLIIPIVTGSSLCATALQRSIRDGQPDFGAAHHRSGIDLDPRSRTPIQSDHEIVVGTVGFAVGP